MMWSLLVYVSAAVVYFAVAATLWGWIRVGVKAKPASPQLHPKLRKSGDGL